MADERGQVFWMNVDYQQWNPLPPVLRLKLRDGALLTMSLWAEYFFCPPVSSYLTVPLADLCVVWRTIVTVVLQQLVNNQSLSKALVSSIVFTKKHWGLRAEKAVYPVSEYLAIFRKGLPNNLWPIPLDPERSVQPLRVYTTHLKIVLTLQVYDRWYFLLLSYFKSLLSWDTYTVVWLDEACSQTTPLWLHAAAGGGQSQEQE